MRQSQIFGSTRKEAPSGETSKNAVLLTRGGYIDKEMAGVYTLLAPALRVSQKIQAIIREELNKLPQTSEVLMPILQLHSLWEESGRRQDIKEIMYDLKDEPVGLGPTHEEVLTDIFRRFFHSYKEMPKAAYQIQTKFRNEPRAKSGLLRGREFMMKDLYSFHTSKEDFEEYYRQVQGAYEIIFKRCGVDAILTEASGGIFSRYSHEYQVLAENGEDTIYLNQNGDNAKNKEVVPSEDDPELLQFCEGKIDKRTSIEIANIFPLGQKFSQPMQAVVAKADGSSSEVYMGCYGIGITRLIGTLVEVYGDLEKGKIVWPKSVAPYKIHLIELKPGLGDELYNQLVQLVQLGSLDQLDILFDDRDLSAGIKFADADLIGAPVRIIISPRTVDQDSIELNGELVKQSELISRLTQ